MVCIPRNVIEAENVVLLGLTCILSDYLHTARDERLGKDDGAVAEWIVDCRLYFPSSQDFPPASMSSMSGRFREVGGGW
jgi:hypothetical protein